MLEQALAHRQELGDRVGEGYTRYNIGLVYHSQGRYGQALAHYEQALALMEEGGDRAGPGTVLTSMGALFQAQARYESALASYRQALELVQEMGNRAGEGAILNNLGATYRAQGEAEAALAVLREALQIHRELGHRTEEGITLNNIGEIYRTQAHYEEALAHFEPALALIRRTEGDRATEGAILRNIGRLFHDRGADEAALETLTEALSIQRQVGNRPLEGLTLYNIGQVHHAQNRFEPALDYYRQALEILDTVRATAGSEAGRIGLMAQYADLYRAVVDLLYQQKQSEAAFLVSEQSRARALLDSLVTGQIQLGDHPAAGLLAREGELYARRQSLQDRLIQARVQSPPDPGLVAELEAQLADIDNAYATVRADLAQQERQLLDLVPGRSRQNVLDVAGVQARLHEQETLLAYYLLDDYSLAFVITTDKFQVVPLPLSGEALQAQVNAFRKFIDTKAVETIQQQTEALYEILIEPVANELTTPRLLIVPHGALHYLPFAALRHPKTGRYLLEQYSLVSLPSASVLPFLPQKSDPEPGLPLVVGNPATGPKTAALLPPERAGLEPLPFAAEEAEAIAALYGVEPLLGPAATEQTVRHRVSQAGLVHLAAHGTYNPVTPLNSFIALAPDEQYDGQLTVGEVFGLDLQLVELVVLSACQTQLGEVSRGDDVIGLTRAFFFAGAPTVVASLWNVDDQATGQLMKRFYTHLSEGQGKAEALRRAQLETMADPKTATPYYWAAFVISGRGGAVSRTLDRQTLWLVGGGMLILVTIAGRLWWRRKRSS
jgi:CHAT domain-containing protein